jgi:hypothetical protein
MVVWKRHFTSAIPLWLATSITLSALPLRGRLQRRTPRFISRMGTYAARSSLH